MSYPYWQFFIALEADLEGTTQYVEPHPDNFSTYSVEFARIILAACSEIDVLCKLLCEKIKPDSRADNINQYRNIIHPHFKGFYELEVQIPRFGLTATPWKNWGTSTNPTWWHSYNKIKHERHQYFSSANFENALHAVAGLFVAVLYLYPKELNADFLQPWPKLLTLNREWNSKIRNDLRPGYVLPDFRQ